MDVFNAFNGYFEIDKFITPVGQTYIVITIVVLNISLLAFLGSMFINKLRLFWQNLSALQRMEIIKQKNMLSYDPNLGGITLTFFPISILMLPLMIPLMLARSERLSDMVLKVGLPTTSVQMNIYLCCL